MQVFSSLKQGKPVISVMALVSLMALQGVHAFEKSLWPVGGKHGWGTGSKEGWLVYHQLFLLNKFESCHERQKNNHISLDF